ncbi:hypothetical protein SASPL_146173 [Salvia splendens]|uniref:Uncharacterized protein n=1 Tax=Salvia splendens TaxID=180675 RepID=A0A8X8WID0_SALSN|nr:hypothetical protein SASPL_146173 [Salvia splendens]
MVIDEQVVTKALEDYEKGPLPNASDPVLPDEEPEDLCDEKKRHENCKKHMMESDKDKAEGKVAENQEQEEMKVRETFRPRNLGGARSLRGIMELITGIGFDWILVFSSPKMLIELAQEFFTSFHFTLATDVGEESIQFRLFTREMRMSIREWSVRLGLYTADQEAEWFARDIDTPKEIPEFNE